MSSLMSKDHLVVPALRGGCWFAIAITLVACGGIAETSDPPSSGDAFNDPAADSSIQARWRPGALEGRAGKRVRSWLDTLPKHPPAQPAAGTLGPSAGTALATCEGDGIIVTNAQAFDTPSSSVTHSGGRWYFEAKVQQFEAGWSSVGVYAPPSDIHYLVAPVSMSGSAAGFSPTGLSTVSVAADLQAGRVYFYVNGVLTSERSLTLLPGVGAFRAGAVSTSGTSMRINLGSEPFAYGVPAGYEPWLGGDEDASGACIPDTGTSAPPAPITVDCVGVDECFPTSFEASTHAHTDLVVLGVYDSGGVGSWIWGTDENGESVPIVTGQGQPGAIAVDVNRPGRVALVLTAYEPTVWTVRTGAGTQLASVSAYGVHLQTVLGLAPDVPLDIHTRCLDGDGGRCSVYTEELFPIGAYQWPYSTGGGDTQGFVRHVEERLGLPLKIFAGAYRARGFVVE